MTCCPLRAQRYTALVIACLVVGLGGSSYLVAILSVDLQKEYRLTQTAVEVILGAGFVADNLGYPWGLLLEHIRERTAFILATLLGATSAFMLYLADNMTDFFATDWWLLALLWACVCSSFIICYLVCVAVSVANFPRAYHGRVLGVLHAAWWLGQALFNYLYVLTEDHEPPRVGTIFLILGIGMLLFKSLAAVFVKPIPLGLLEKQLLESDEEKETKRKKKILSKESWGVILGVDMLCNIDFHLLCWGFVCGTSVTIMYIVNVASICQALSLADLDEVILPYAALCGMLVSFMIGFLSDLTLTNLPREAYLAMVAGLQCILFSLSTAYAQSSPMFIVSVFSIYGFNSAYYIIAGAILGDYFGTRHVKRNYGVIRMLTAAVSFVLVIVYGEIFDQVDDLKDDAECVGSMCLYDMFVISAVLSCVSCIAFVMLSRRCVTRPIIGDA